MLVEKCRKVVSCGVKQGLCCIGVNTSDESLEEHHGGQNVLITSVVEDLFYNTQKVSDRQQEERHLVL